MKASVVSVNSALCFCRADEDEDGEEEGLVSGKAGGGAWALGKGLFASVCV